MLNEGYNRRARLVWSDLENGCSEEKIGVGGSSDEIKGFLSRFD